MRDPVLRRRLAEVMTRPAWLRLMPDAYSEAEEFKREVRRLQPQWLRDPPDQTHFKHLRSDWRKTTGGFWSRARHDPDGEHARIVTLDGGTVESSRANARRQRQDISETDRSTLDKPLSALVGRPAEAVEGWAGGPVDLWRLAAWSFMTSALRNQGSAHYEWLSGEVDLSLALFRTQDWTRFWFYDAQAAGVPRMWLRSALEFMQAFFKVTDGTPVDAQIGSYAAEVDVILSGDRRFVDMCKRCNREAPFTVADASLLSSGPLAVEELLDLVGRL